MKLSIPESHRKIFKDIFLWLDETENAVVEPSFCSTEFVEKLLEGYKIIDGGSTSAPSPVTEPRYNPTSNTQTISYKKISSSTRSGIKGEIERCTLCPLCERRKRFIDFGGETTGALMLLTDIPEYYDEIQGRLFTDEVGKLLEKMVCALSVNYESTYKTSALKCTSPILLGGDLTKYKPCLEYLKREILQIKPIEILAMGDLTSRLLFSVPLSETLGKEMEWCGHPVIMIHHPREMMYDVSLKKETWDIIKPYVGKW